MRTTRTRSVNFLGTKAKAVLYLLILLATVFAAYTGHIMIA